MRSSAIPTVRNVWHWSSRGPRSLRRCERSPAPQLSNRSLLAATGRSGDVFADVLVSRCGQFLGGSVENHLAIAQYHERGAIINAPAGRQVPHLIGFLVEVVGRHGEGVLQ